ncbi:MAG: undecaprenyl-diphosphate phosphatase [Deltaproteobacteria bacterium]|nr:undecaprenyl-diphosphate phosphatase [Deltaproteobacteria bacterium]
MIHLSLLHALILAVLQGITELFPVSSLAHGVIVPKLLGWHINRQSEGFLPFLVVLHLGTAFALLIYFYKDWINLFKGFFTGLKNKNLNINEGSKTLYLLALATIPAGLIGLLFVHKLKRLFGFTDIAAVFLMVNGVILYLGEKKRRKQGIAKISDMTIAAALIIGAFQSFALIPGISRSAITMVAALYLGFKHEYAARFSFLLATPIILAAGLLEVPKMLKLHMLHFTAVSLASGAVAGIAAYLSVYALMKYFHKYEVNALYPFAFYCIIFGAFVLTYRFI